jgi:CHAT domain-containing protein
VKNELESIIWKEDAGGSNQGIIPGIILLDEVFTEEALIDVLNKDIPIVHIASHFTLRSNIADSYLLLGDGTHLTLERFREESFRLEKVDLLTLSAPDTAIESGIWTGREMEGLAALALNKGAKSVIATLWPIADESTGIFMPHFYSMMLQEEGVTKADALRQTQIEFIGGNLRNPNSNNGIGHPDFPFYTHPYFWAPFILMGNWL